MGAKISQPQSNPGCWDIGRVLSGGNWSWNFFWGLKYQYLKSKQSLQNDPKYSICIALRCLAPPEAAARKIGWCPDLNISSNFSPSRKFCRAHVFMARRQNRDTLKMLARFSLTLTEGGAVVLQTLSVHLWTKRLGTKVSFFWNSSPKDCICNTDELSHSNLPLFCLFFWVLISVFLSLDPYLQVPWEILSEVWYIY